MSGEVRVAFLPWDAHACVDPGTTLLEAARVAGVTLSASCGGVGTCGNCAVSVLAGDLEPPTPAERAALPSRRSDVRLACLARVSGDVTVRPLAAASPAGLERGLGEPAAPGRDRAVAGVDLGTTTIAAVAAAPGGRQGWASAPNPQSSFGADVASRLTAALEGEGGAMADAARSGVEAAVGVACEAAGVAPSGLERVVIAGNTAMAHLLAGAPITGLAQHPYAPSFAGPLRGSAASFGLRSAGEASVYVVPAAGAFVGGDLVAGLLAEGLNSRAGTQVFADIGTNAEVAVSAGGRLVAASAPAGPAFEAVGIACGGPGVPGAVERVELVPGSDGEIAVVTIGGVAPAWISGSGLVDVVRLLLLAGHLDETGLMRPDGPLRARFHRRADVLAVQVAGERGAETDIYVTQLDVRALQLAKAALQVALAAALGAAGVGWPEVERLLVAGAFGAALRPGSLRGLGVVPPSAPLEETVGDAALHGALLIAEDESLEERAEDAAARVTVVDLPALDTFGEEFVAATRFE